MSNHSVGSSSCLHGSNRGRSFNSIEAPIPPVYSPATEKIYSRFENAVYMLAQTMPVNGAACYTITPNFFKHMVEGYLQENPSHQNPAQLGYKNQSGKWKIDFYDLTYQIHTDREICKSVQWVPELQDKLPVADTQLQRGTLIENRYAYIPESGRMAQVGCKIAKSNGNVDSKKYAYIPELHAMHLVKQTKECVGKPPRVLSWKFNSSTQTMVERSFEKHEYCGKVEEGFFQQVPGLQADCRYLVDGKRIVFNKRTAAYDLYEGEFAFVPGASQTKNGTFLVCGRSYTSDKKLTAQGRFVFYEALQKVRLADGTLSDPAREDKGEWAYIQGLNEVELIHGTRTYPNGQTETGRREYIPELKRMELVEGVKQDSNGTKQSGFWVYRPDQRRMDFTSRYFLTPAGAREDGRRPYFPELNGFALKEGIRTMPDGTQMVGKFDVVPDHPCGAQYTFLLQGRIDYPVLANPSPGYPQAMPGYRDGQFAYIPELRQMRLVNGEEVFDGIRLEGRWIYSARKHDMAISNFTGSNKKTLQELVQNLEKIAKLLDPEAKTQPIQNGLTQAIKHTLQAQTLENEHQGLNEIRARTTSLIRQLTPFCHPDKGFTHPAYKETYIGLMKLNDHINQTLDLAKGTRNLNF